MSTEAGSGKASGFLSCVVGRLFNSSIAKESKHSKQTGHGIEPSERFGARVSASSRQLINGEFDPGSG